MTSYSSKRFNKAKALGQYCEFSFESAVRVSSLPTQQNLVHLGPDKIGVFFNRGPQSFAEEKAWAEEPLSTRQASYTDRFGGDFGYNSYHDEVVMLSDNSVRKMLSPLTELDAQNQQFLDLAGSNPFVQPVMLDDHEVIFGPMYHTIKVKSATIGAAVKCKLIKCVARYDIPNRMHIAQASPGTSVRHELAEGDGFGDTEIAIDSYSTTNSAYDYMFGSNDMSGFIGLQMFTRNIDTQQTDLNRIISEGGTYWTVSTFSDLIKAMQPLRQPGAGLDTVPNLLNILEIVESKSVVLMPGQDYVVKNSMPAKVFNETKNGLESGLWCRKGQVFYFINVIGVLGHEAYVPVGDSRNQNQANQYNGEGEIEAGGAFFLQNQSRPLMGLMPAHVDVLCVKNCAVGYLKKMKRQPIRNRVVLDDISWEAVTGVGPTLAFNPSHSEAPTSTADNTNRTGSDVFVDSFPSFFDANPAYVDKLS